jgi:hypothetical protein
MKPIYLEGLDEEVEKKLRKAQEKKEFKDAGERVRGSKKEKRAISAIIALVDLNTLEEDEATAIEMIVKDRVWAKYDAQAEIDKGVTSGCAFLKTKFRSAFPPHPNARTKSDRRSYVGFAELFQRLLEKCLTLNDLESLWKFVRDITHRDVENILYVFDELENHSQGNLQTIYSNVAIKKSILKICGSEFYNLLTRYTGNGTHPIWERAKNYDGITVEYAENYLIKWNERTRNELKACDGFILRLRTATYPELAIEKKTWRRVPKDMGAFRLLAIEYYNKKIIGYKARLDNPPENEKAHPPDWSWSQVSAKKKSEKKTELFINKGKPLDYIKRTGGLEITAVKEDEIIELFGFRAVEFGNAIRDVEAKEHVRHFLSACSDLFEVLNYDAKTINGLGELAIAFGSRGTGKACAQYFPGRRIINITNKKGDGSVAHEWAHYLDHMLYKLLILGNDSNETFATAHLNSLNRCATTDALRSLMEFIVRGDGEYKPMLVRFPRRDQHKYNFRAQTIDDCLIDLKDDNENLFRDYFSDGMEDAKRVFGYLATKFNLDYVDVEMQIHRTTAYYNYSSAMGSIYWRDPVELFARAFETYAYDKLIKAKMFNNYLVSGDYFDHPLHVYPYGSDREKLFLLYDNLIHAISADFNIPAFVPHTEFRTDEYIILDANEEEEKVESGVIAMSSLSELLRLEVNLYKVA